LRPGANDTRPVHGQQVTVKCSGRLERDSGAEGGGGSEVQGLEDVVIDQHDSLSMVLGDGDYIHGKYGYRSVAVLVKFPVPQN